MRAEHAAADVPPGWNHNPTSLRRRAMLAGLAFVGLAVAMYLTLYQFDFYRSLWGPWEPKKVVDLVEPVPDALFGVLAYGTELLLLALGGRDRWRTLPWTCLTLGAVLATGAVVSIVLVIIQPTVAGAWCLLCLVSAAVSLALFALGFGEALAAWQFVSRARRDGATLGDAFWGRAGRPQPRRDVAAATTGDRRVSART